MFIAMNRFRVTKGSEAAFEHVWMSRDTHLHKVPGFIEFHLLKGPEAEDHTLYASHTVWRAAPPSRRGQSPRRSAQRIVAPATTSRFISDTRNSRRARRWGWARPRWRDRG
jgi:heme-degrading monooxygenase HmoA